VQVTFVSAGAFSMSGVVYVSLHRVTMEISKLTLGFYVVSVSVSDHRI
jgi:hypothetical protein